MATLTGGAFVGRQREMGELKTALEDALSGQGRLVMLAGEPGIGKTRLAQEVADYAQQRGVRALWGRCHSSQGPPHTGPGSKSSALICKISVCKDCTLR
jgi:predicted ATPase